MKIVNVLTLLLLVSSSSAATLNFSTFIGTNLNDFIDDLDVDSNGNSIILGSAYYLYIVQNQFPTTSGALLEIPPLGNYTNSYWDIVVASFTNDGSALNFSTYYGGGSGTDQGIKLKIDNNGNYYILGKGVIPTTNNAFSPNLIGSADFFISVLSGDGSSIIYSTYFGGSQGDEAYSLELGSNGDVYVTGKTNSVNFPTNTGAFSQNFAGGQDVFISSLNNDLSSLVFSTYLGTSNEDIGQDLDVGINGEVVVTGTTNSINFPTTPNAFYPNSIGGIGSFTTSFSNNGSNIDFSTYMGGNTVNFYNDDVIVSGSGLGQAYPLSSGVFDTVTGYGALFSYTSDGSALNYATYLGTDSKCLDLDNSGNMYIIGYPYQNFITTSNAFDTTYIGLSISKISSDGSNLLYGSFIGGTASESVGNIIYRNGSIYCGGSTNGSTFPTTQGSYDQNFNGGWDIFVFRMDFPKELDDVEISYSNSDVVLNWSEIPTATNYKIYRNTLPDFNSATNIGNLAPSGNQPVYTDSGALQSNSKYYYFVTWED
ncbi:MAG: hypothetical protein DWQ06_00255 [Calditrichaeota bacterium]|nr:MAG: hypothetical protein DWQ06_00255 [Calditrichota bacterium]